jgi:hypothetical protein
MEKTPKKETSKSNQTKSERKRKQSKNIQIKDSDNQETLLQKETGMFPESPSPISEGQSC